MEPLFVYLTELSSGVAYWIIFGVLVACGLGFPLPEDVPLVATGYLVWDGTIKAFPALMMTLSGVMIGDSILFYIGSRFGLGVLSNPRFAKIFTPEKVTKSKAYFEKYGDKIVFVARFFAGFRAVAFFMAGALHMKYRRFVFWDLFAALLSVPIWIGVGYGLGHIFGDSINDILAKMKDIKVAVTVVLVLVVLIVIGTQGLKYYRSKKSASLQKP